MNKVAIKANGIVSGSTIHFVEHMVFYTIQVETGGGGGGGNVVCVFVSWES